MTQKNSLWLLRFRPDQIGEHSAHRRLPLSLNHINHWNAIWFVKLALGRAA
jgi:hypothetical protein